MSKTGIYKLSAGTFAKLDRGTAEAAFDRALKAAAQDCIDRPGDDRERIVKMEVKLVPVTETIDNTLSCEGCKGLYRVTWKIPPYESGELDFGVRQDGSLVFSENSPKDHRQKTFFDEEEE